MQTWFYAGCVLSAEQQRGHGCVFGWVLHSKGDMGACWLGPKSNGDMGVCWVAVEQHTYSQKRNCCRALILANKLAGCGYVTDLPVLLENHGQLQDVAA